VCFDAGVDEHGEQGTAPRTRRCTGCGEDLPVEAFAIKDRTRGTRQARCGACLRASRRTWYAANAESVRETVRISRAERHRRNAAIIRQAKDRPCTDCGAVLNPEQMDFDHVRGQKLFDVARMVRDSSVERLLFEIAKCEVVCAVCHRLRTHTASDS
jgi:hypothetical protein